MNDAKPQTPRRRSGRSRTASEDQSDGKADVTALPEGRTRTPAAETERAQPREEGSGAQQPPRKGKKRPEGVPEGGLPQIVTPIFDGFAQSMTAALEPVLQDVQAQMAQVIAQRVEGVLPVIGAQLQQEAQREVGDALLAMQREHQSAEVPADAAAERRASPSSIPSSKDKAHTLVVERVDRPPREDEQGQGVSPMATKTDKGKGTDEEETAQTQREDSGETNESSRSSASAGSNSANAGNGSPRALQARPSQPTYSFDPQGAARAGLLNLASRWKESGALYQAIPAYMEILTTYPGTGAAAAATEGLVDLAHRLEDQGRFYTALSIFRKLELML